MSAPTAPAAAAPRGFVSPPSVPGSPRLFDSIDVSGNGQAITIRGVHSKHLSRANTTTIAALLNNDHPAFSSGASRVVKYDNGVTAYDITPGLGPKFAYRVSGISEYDLGNGTRVAIVALKIGDDPETGAKSDYEGTAYEIFITDDKGTRAAEFWNNVNAKTDFAATAAKGGHNLIVHGVFGINGFVGLTKSAADWDRTHSASPQLVSAPPPVTVTQDLLDFVRDDRLVSGLLRKGIFDHEQSAALTRQLFMELHRPVVSEPVGAATGTRRTGDSAPVLLAGLAPPQRSRA